MSSYWDPRHQEKKVFDDTFREGEDREKHIKKRKSEIITERAQARREHYKSARQLFTEIEEAAELLFLSKSVK